MTEACRGEARPRPGRPAGSPLRDLLILTRYRLSAAVAATAGAGGLLAGGGAAMLSAAAGVFLLAAGASALNQVQERALDGRMERTRRRPLPAGRLSPPQGGSISLLLIFGGLLLLALTDGLAFLLGAGAVLLYNGLYTHLKPRTLFALLPGALAGALPPLIGWCAAGAPPLDARILLPAGCLFLWQVPHFLLLAERHREDLRKAGLPALNIALPRHAGGILAVWLLSLAFASFAALTAAPFPPLPVAAGGGLLFLFLASQALRVVRRPLRLPLYRLPRTLDSAMLGFALLLFLRNWTN